MCGCVEQLLLYKYTITEGNRKTKKAARCPQMRNREPHDCLLTSPGWQRQSEIMVISIRRFWRKRSFATRCTSAAVTLSSTRSKSVS